MAYLRLPWGPLDAGGMFGLPQQQASRPRRPSLADLLDPLAVEPQYPTAPTPITRARDLGGQDRSDLTMEMLANLAAAIGGSEPGYLGSGLARAAGANLDAQRNAIARAREEQESTYAQERQRADIEARRQTQQRLREQQERELSDLIEQGDRAIELAGGEETDPAFAEQVYSAVRTRNLSQLSGLAKTASERRAMRDAGLNPDDALAIDDFKAKRAAKAALQAKLDEEKTLGPIRSARELREYRKKQEIEEEFEDPPVPTKPNMIYDSRRGIIVNEDDGTFSPIPGLPEPRDGNAFDDVEKLAIEKTYQDRFQYQNRPGGPPIFQNKSPKYPGYTTNPSLVGKPVPFDFGGAFSAHERNLRGIENRKRAEADPSLGQRNPGAPAPVGPGGGQPPPQRSVDQKLADIEATVGQKLPASVKAEMRRSLAAGVMPRSLVEEFYRDNPHLRKR